MPDYFYHVAIELFPSDEPSVKKPQPLPLSPFFKALRPFHSQSTKREPRNSAVNQRKENALKTANLPHERSVSSSPKPDYQSNPNDPRIDHIQVEGSNMDKHTLEQQHETKTENIVGTGIGTSISGHYMKGHYEAVEDSSTEGWGIVHLYRDAEETPGLYHESPLRYSDLWSDSTRRVPTGKPSSMPTDDECTSLCILAVPSYMTPSDFLAFVGEDTREEVSHFRMVRTSRANRYMVLMKFKNGKKARNWQHEWNGRVFNSIEPETCHVVFLKSVELIQTSNNTTTNGLTMSTESTSFPRMTNDPFIPTSTMTKPLPPRTASLVELPTCPVCLERMDETTGLLTIPCQHVFHCTCLEKWSGGGCPVCRYTNDDFSSRLASHKTRSKHLGEYEPGDDSIECEACHVATSLWQCLICGKVGCGRYEGKHAYTHFEESGHTFSMDLESKRVWDYAGDGYVHRIIQDAAKPGEKLVELPGRRRDITALEGHEDVEVAKMENVAIEYTHLLTSQLESQRVYFEEIVDRAVDKAAEASKKADRATEESRQALQQLRMLENEYDMVAKGQIPELEKEKLRLEKRSNKFESMAKDVNQRYLEEKSVVRSLMERIEHLEGTQMQQLKQQIQNLEEDNATKDLLMEGLKEEHRDAMMQVSAAKKLQEMVANGEIEAHELEGASITAGPAGKDVLTGNGKSKGKGKSRK